MKKCHYFSVSSSFSVINLNRRILIRPDIALLLCQVKQHYCDVPVYVMANGAQEDPACFKDSLRVYYLYNYINEALKGEITNTHLLIKFTWEPDVIIASVY